MILNKSCKYKCSPGQSGTLSEWNAPSIKRTHMELYSVLCANLDGTEAWERENGYMYKYSWIPSLFT